MWFKNFYFAQSPLHNKFYFYIFFDIYHEPTNHLHQKKKKGEVREINIIISQFPLHPPSGFPLFWGFFGGNQNPPPPHKNILKLKKKLKKNIFFLFGWGANGPLPRPN